MLLGRQRRSKRLHGNRHRYGGCETGGGAAQDVHAVLLAKSNPWNSFCILSPGRTTDEVSK
jgi:hypothetical protein